MVRVWAVCLVVLISACGDDDDGPIDAAPLPDDAAAPADAAAPDAAAVDAALPDAGAVDAGWDGGAFGTCTAPLPIAIGAGLIATTDTPASDHIWSSDCADTSVGEDPVGPETVFELAVPQTKMLSYVVTPLISSIFGLYVRYECDTLAAELGRFCDSNVIAGGGFSFSRLTPPGTFYLFVDDFGSLGMGPGEFTLLVQEIAVPACHGQVPVILATEDAPLAFSGDTSAGSAVTDWVPTGCGSVLETLGAENIYGFALAAPATVTVIATPTTPSTSQIAVYIRHTCDDSSTQVACDSAVGGAATIAQLLPAGDYYLFVDDFADSIDEPQTYSLTLSIAL